MHTRCCTFSSIVKCDAHCCRRSPKGLHRANAGRYWPPVLHIHLYRVSHVPLCCHFATYYNFPEKKSVPELNDHPTYIPHIQNLVRVTTGCAVSHKNRQYAELVQYKKMQGFNMQYWNSNVTLNIYHMCINPWCLIYSAYLLQVIFITNKIYIVFMPGSKVHRLVQNCGMTSNIQLTNHSVYHCSFLGLI